LKKIGVVLKRAVYFITCCGRMMYNTKLEEDYICSALLSDCTQIPREIRDAGYRQISLFDSDMPGVAPIQPACAFQSRTA
jgi:predicted DNA-binding helix-hairpin-helix protein